MLALMPRNTSRYHGVVALLFLVACGRAPISAGKRDAAAQGADAETSCSGTFCAGACVDTETDKRHCGACDQPCSALSPSIAECVAGRCLVTLNYGQRDAWRVAVDEASVYWLYLQGGVVMKIPIEGGSPTKLAASGGQGVGIAVDGTDVYWTDFTLGLVMRVPREGGPAVTIVSGDMSRYPDAIALDAGSIYWTNSGSGLVANGTIMKMPMAGGSPQTLATGQSLPMGIAVDAANVYWIDDGGAVKKVALAGGATTILHDYDSQIPRDIAVDGASVYWTQPDAGTVMKVPVAGGSATVLASGQGGPHAIAVDERYLYWTNADAGTIMKLPKDGGTPITLASGQGRPFDIAVDDVSVYWTNSGDGRVMKLHPK
jgi:hypothetical protein